MYKVLSWGSSAHTIKNENDNITIICDRQKADYIAELLNNTDPVKKDYKPPTAFVPIMETDFSHTIPDNSRKMCVWNLEQAMAALRSCATAVYCARLGSMDIKIATNIQEAEAIYEEHV